MSLFELLVIVLVVALFVFLINIAPWVPANWKRIANWIGGLILIMIVLSALGVIDMLKSIIIPRVR